MKTTKEQEKMKVEFEKRKCIQCEKEFQPSSVNQKYCLQLGCTPIPHISLPLNIRRQMYKRRWKERNPEFQKNFAKIYRETHAEEIRIYEREYNKNNRGIRREIEIRYSRSHPLVKLAHQKSRYLPMSSTCEKCGHTQDLEKHHPDYKEPMKIITLCKKCHLEEHSEVI